MKWGFASLKRILTLPTQNDVKQEKKSSTSSSVVAQAAAEWQYRQALEASAPKNIRLAAADEEGK